MNKTEGFVVCSLYFYQKIENKKYYLSLRQRIYLILIL